MVESSQSMTSGGPDNKQASDSAKRRDDTAIRVRSINKPAGVKQQVIQQQLNQTPNKKGKALFAADAFKSGASQQEPQIKASSSALRSSQQHLLTSKGGMVLPDTGNDQEKPQKLSTMAKLRLMQQKRTQAALSKDSLLKAPFNPGLSMSSFGSMSEHKQNKSQLGKVPYNCDSEENKSSTGPEQSYTVNKSRVSTAKSTVSNYSVKNAMNLSRMPEMRQYQARELVRSDSSLSVAEQSLVEKSLIQPNVLFDPNEEVVEENSVLAQIVKTNTQLLQKCLKSNSKAVYFSAIDNLKNAVTNFGPALNKHLPQLLPLIAKKQALASDERISGLKEAIFDNCGEDARKLLEMFPLKG